MHAPWAGAEFLRGGRVLDGFAGTGAYGLEALSRGAAAADFVENSGAALAALRANIAACKAEAVTRVIAGDVLSLPSGAPHDLVFLDPPYGKDFVARALAALLARGWITAGSIVVAELGPGDTVALPEMLSERVHGKAQLVFGRM